MNRYIKDYLLYIGKIVEKAIYKATEAAACGIHFVKIAEENISVQFVVKFLKD
jgi:hypothetical protein